MNAALVPRRNLTPEQLRAVELPTNRHRVIVGGPGSGKTQILLHRARHLLDSKGLDPDNLRVFVYTRLLRDYLKSAMAALRLPPEIVTTLDAWCADYYRSYIGRRLPALKGSPNFPLIRSRVCEHLEYREPVFDCVLVDEGQDLDESAYWLLKAAGKHITVCMDHKQQVYAHGSTSSEVLSALGLTRQGAVLLGHYRSSPYVVQAAAHFLADPEEKRLHLLQARKPEGTRTLPLVYVAADKTDETRQLAMMVRTRLSLGDSVAVLFPKNRQVFGYQRALADHGIEAYACGNEEADFTSPEPKLMTYHSAKGLTFDSVFLPRLVPSSFPGWLDVMAPNMLFVGVSRAIEWVYLSSVAGHELSLLSGMRRLASGGYLEWRERDGEAVEAEYEEPEPEEEALPYD